ncbi:LysR family transcriptional regulator [Gammaproteobacteria bacterium AS21]
MNWTLDQLEAFVTSVKQGSFSAGARKLGKAQSRVSSAIANLEADLGFELFDRSARLPVLTVLGEEMLVEAQAVLSQCQRLQARAIIGSNGEELALTLAVDEAVPILSLESFFCDVSLRFPLLKLTIINGSQDDIARWIEDKTADLGVLFHLKPLSEHLELAIIGQFNHALVVSVNHPLTNTPIPTYAQLNQYRQLVIRNRLGGAPEKAISVQHWYVDSYYHITGLVSRGIGWALVPEHIANDQWNHGKLVELSTEHIPDSLVVEMGIVKRLDQGKGPIMSWMYDAIKDIFKGS